MKPTDLTPPQPPSVLDADILEALNLGQTAAALEPSRAANIRHRVMARVAQDSTTRHQTVATDQGQWQRFLPGIECKVLHQSGEVMSYLLRLAPGAQLPAHHHPMDEECVVLQGRLRIGNELVLQTGDFHLAHEGLPHDTIVSDEGAVIFLRGAVPVAEHLV
jgi:quercetin dioxygenase-like cupin family protein